MSGYDEGFDEGSEMGARLARQHASEAARLRAEVAALRERNAKLEAVAEATRKALATSACMDCVWSEADEIAVGAALAALDLVFSNPPTQQHPTK